MGLLCCIQLNEIRSLYISAVKSEADIRVQGDLELIGKNGFPGEIDQAELYGAEGKIFIPGA